MERSVHDALCVVKRVLESHLVVPGGGAVETALSVYLENFARTLVGEAGGEGRYVDRAGGTGGWGRGNGGWGRRSGRWDRGWFSFSFSFQLIALC